jgi:integrase
MEHNPARHLKREKENAGRVRFLSDDERKDLLAACKESSCPSLYTAVVLTLSTGMRKEEFRNLKWSDVDLKKGVIILKDTKNKKQFAYACGMK